MSWHPTSTGTNMIDNVPKPVFLISLPRSGSTLLQRMLMAHSQVASHAEPWFLLPLVYSSKKESIRTNYGQKQAYKAIHNLYRSLPDGKSDYLSSLAGSARCLYQKLSGGASFFVDKTPRYYFILDELHWMFPEALFIYLYRNPLSVFASSIESFSSNRARRLDHLDRDFLEGPGYISESFNLNQSNILKVRYEDIVLNPEETMSQVCRYLNLDLEQGMIKKFSQSQINGHGDERGIARYKSLSDNTQRWKMLLDNSYRKFRAIQYIKNIDSRYLEQGGYNRENLLFELRNHNPALASPEWLYLVEEKMVRWAKRLIQYRTLS